MKSNNKQILEVNAEENLKVETGATNDDEEEDGEEE